jgi:peroxiredoxin
MKIIPRTQVPDLLVDTVGRGEWRLSEQKPENLTLIVFYRGHHCPLCKKQLQEFERMLPDFEQRGIQVFAVSSNTRELAEKTVEEWELANLSVGYGLPIEEALRWGLFVSNAIKDTEPKHFTEPGLFVIAPERTLYASMIQTMPFSRPSARQLLNSLDYIVTNGYTARGEGQIPEQATA